MSTLSIIASVFSISSMVLYCVILLRGNVTPNPATWIIWLAIGAINVSTYIFVMKGDVLRALPLCFVVLGIFAVTVYSIATGSFAKLKTIDAFCFLLALAIGIFWKLSGDPITANLLLQLVYVISFIPTVAGLRAKALQESSLPWILAILAYLFMIAEILLQWKSSSWVALVHPVVNGLIGNGAVAYYAMKKHSRAPSAELATLPVQATV